MKNLFRKPNLAAAPQVAQIKSAPRVPDILEAEHPPTHALQCETTESPTQQPIASVEHVRAQQYGRILDQIVLEQHALLDLICAAAELREAQTNAMARGISVGDSLRNRFESLRDLRERTIREQRELRARQREDMQRAGPAILAALAERERLAKTIAAVSHSIASFDAAREDFVTNLRRAGLSHEEIAGIDPKPTPAELTKWREELVQAQARDDKLTQMLGRGTSAFLVEVSQ